MLNAKEGYPSKLSNNDIKEEIYKLRQYANGGERKAEIISAANSIIRSGQDELNERFQRKAFFLTLTLTVLSVIAAGTSILFSFRADVSDNQWKDSEIRILNKIELNTSKI